MRIICPFTDLSTETRDALDGVDVEYVDVSARQESYWQLLADLWADRADFCIVEQDIVVNPDTLATFEACWQPFCAAPYPYLGSGTYAGLGCTRFRAAVMEAEPDLMQRVAEYDFVNHGPKHWCTLDASIQFELRTTSFRVCVHQPVGHLHDQPTHGCCSA